MQFHSVQIWQVHTIVCSSTIKPPFYASFFWFHDVEGRLERGKVYQQATQAFGDTAAAFGLEVAILKYIVAYAVLSVSKYILEYIRYSDNILYSFETQEEYRKVKKDLEESFAKFSLPLKYLISSTEYEPKMMEDPKRGPSRIEKTMGLLWDLIDDTITALPRYNLHGSSRGKATGPDLVDMKVEEIMNMCITRMTFLRLSAQTYSRLGNLLGPLITAIKILASHSCDLPEINELDVDLEDRDAQFVKFAREFIVNLRKVK